MSLRPQLHPITFNEACGLVLEEIEAAAENRKMGEGAAGRPGRISTGILELDEAFGGGLERGRLTIFGAQDERLAEALALKVAYGAIEPALLVVPDIRDAIRLSLTVLAGVPDADLVAGSLSDDDWLKIAHAVEGVSRGRNLLIESISVDQIAKEIPIDQRLVVVLAPERLGHGGLTGIDRLSEFAAQQRCAVVAPSGTSLPRQGPDNRPIDSVLLRTETESRRVAGYVFTAPMSERSPEEVSFDFDRESTTVEFSKLAAPASS